MDDGLLFVSANLAARSHQPTDDRSVFSFVGHFALDQDDPMATPEAGGVLIAFSCLAIAAFAATWGPLSWAVVAELYPSQYRARCMALATAGNWLCNL